MTGLGKSGPVMYYDVPLEAISFGILSDCGRRRIVGVPTRTETFVNILDTSPVWLATSCGRYFLTSVLNQTPTTSCVQALF